jgi:hypothetical protein
LSVAAAWFTVQLIHSTTAIAMNATAREQLSYALLIAEDR